MGENSVVYQIAKWDEHFENAKSRGYKSKGKGNFPIKLGGSGYRRMMREEDGPAMYGCFIALCMIAHMGSSTDRQGYLTDTGGIAGEPYDIETLSLLTDMPSDLIKKTIDYCSQNNVNWILIHSLDGAYTAGIPEGYREDSTISPNKQDDKQGNKQENERESSAGARVHESAEDVEIYDGQQAMPDWSWDKYVEHFQSVSPEYGRISSHSILNALRFAPDNDLMAEAYNQCVADIMGSLEPIKNPAQMLKKYMQNAEKHNGNKGNRRNSRWLGIKEKLSGEVTG